MTPLGHLSVSFLLGKSSRKLVVPALILGGLLPDIDFILLPFAFFNQVHRVLTHNLLFVSTAALLSAYLWRSQKNTRLIFLCVLLGGVLHLFVDSCLDGNASNGIGITLLWPFSGEFFSPLNLLSPRGTAVGWAKPIVFLRSSLGDVIPELPFWGAAVLLFTREVMATMKHRSFKHTRSLIDES